MKNITIISASVRTGRKSNRVATWFEQKLSGKGCLVTMADLKEYDFPLFHERLRFLESPAENLLDYAQKIKSANGIIIVTPEYNGGIPSSLKNAIDVLYDEWHGKPVALVAVSNGNFGGSQVLTSLLFTLWKIGTWVVPASFQVPNIDKSGTPTDEEGTNKRADAFLEKFFWHVEA
ncbi:MAG: NADPH-dependent oxidoreductase, partial [Chitinophagaceae bacterium]